MIFSFFNCSVHKHANALNAIPCSCNSRLEKFVQLAKIRKREQPTHFNLKVVPGKTKTASDSKLYIFFRFMLK